MHFNISGERDGMYEYLGFTSPCIPSCTHRMAIGISLQKRTVSVYQLIMTPSSPSRRQKVIDYVLHEGLPIKEVAAETKYSVSGCRKIIKNYLDRGTNKSLPRPGRVPIMNERAVRRLERDILRDPTLGWSERAGQHGVSVDTVKSVAAKLGLFSPRPRRKPMLPSKAKKAIRK